MSTYGNQAIFDPVVDHAGADAQPPGNLLHREFSRLPIIGTSDAMLVANPLDAFDSEGISFVGCKPFIVQASSDLNIARRLGQLSHTLDQLVIMSPTPPRAVGPDSRRSLRGRNSCRLLDWKQTGSESPATVNFPQPLRVMIRSKTGQLLFGRCIVEMVR